MKVKILFILSIIVLCCMRAFGSDGSAGQIKIDSYTFGALEARSIGPAVMSGRISVIDAVNKNPNIIYVGTANGGIWKSKDGGNRFKPIFDKHIQSIGTIKIDQAHPDTVWVGTGECWVRNSVSVGGGVFKSTDGGDNWQLMGLKESERIADILIDPDDPNIVYVAAMGHLWNGNEERGVYKTTDGGKSWERILYIDENTGCADLEMDPQEPTIIYAAMWQFRRWPYFFKSGGPGSGLYKSIDGGKNWTKLTNGLPEGELGRIAIAAAPSRPGRLYASVEAKKKESGLFMSDDYGHTWTKVTSASNVLYRPFYFSFMRVDPKDYNTIYKTAYMIMISSDGGKSFRQSGAGVHPDIHAIWINPNNPSHLLTGTDGGVYVSYDKGFSWRFLRSLPVSQFYHVSCDMQKPYNVYGGLQDNGSWFGPSKSPDGIENKDWENVGGGDGFCVFADPTDNSIIYSEWQEGNIQRVHLKTREVKDIKPAPKEGEPEYRFNWNTPIAMSPNRPGKIYIGAQFLFYSTDKGESWVRISDDLTTNDPEKLKQSESGGLTIDNSGAENHCTIFTISESPMNEKIIWVGTDDGNLQITTNGGKSWENVVGNISGLPSCTWCSSVEASHFDEATAYVTFDGHMTGDMNTYIYKTTDYGKSWQSIATEQIKGYAHVIKEDFVKRDLLFVGTEFGLFITIDGGNQWAQFTGNLPNVSVMDIAIHPRESDVILATHGRGIYIIDDITPIRHISRELLSSEIAFLPSKPTIVKTSMGSQYWPGGDEFVGQNPKEAAKIIYYMKKRHIFGDMRIEIYNSDDKLIKTLPGGKRRGINIVEWAMRLKPPKVPRSPVLAGGALLGPTVPEGTYKVKLIKGKKTYTTEIKIMADPDSPHSAADRALRDKIVWKLYGMQERLAYVSEAMIDARDQAKKKAEGMKKKDKVRKLLESFADRLDELNKSIVATQSGGISGEEKLREKVVGLYGSVVQYAGRPTQTQIERTTLLEKEIERASAKFEDFIKKELPGVNRALTKKKMEPIKVMTKEQWDKKQENS